MPTILIAADICPIEDNLPFFTSGDADSLVHDLLPEFQQADLAIANLECPLIEHASPIAKTGPTFGESPDCINGIRNIGIDVLGLANNHILDHGPAGLKNTLEVCIRAGIATVGAGSNLRAAREIVVRQAGSARVGFLAVAEREFSIATKTSWGANPLDLMDFVRNVTKRRKDFDYLVVLLHGAHEFQPISPRIQDTCRFMIEMGANAVVVQQPHCLGGYENYRGGHIVYGQGALIMDEAIYRNEKSFHEGFLVKLGIHADFTSTMEIVPFIQSDPAPGARGMRPEEEKELRQRLEERSRWILDEAFVEAEWIKFCDARKHGYLSAMLGHNRPLRLLNKNGLLERVLYGKRRLLSGRNIVCCETHREAVQTIFDAGLV